MSDKNMVLGFVAGGLIVGGLVAFFNGTDQGKRLKREAANKFRDLKGYTEDLLDEFEGRAEDVQEKIADQYADLSDRACCLFDSFKNEYSKIVDNIDPKQGLFIAGVVGLIAGIGTSILVSEGVKGYTSNARLNAFGSRKRDWKKFVLGALNGLENKNFFNNSKKSSCQSLDQLLDFAQVGAKMWKTFRA